MLIWDGFLSFDRGGWRNIIVALLSICIITQRQRHTHQLKHQIKMQDQVEQLHQNAITDLELAVAQREQIQHDLAHKEALLHSFLEASPDLLYYCNEEHQFFGCNRAMELLTGKSQRQIIGLTPQQLYSDIIAQQESATNSQLFKTNRSITYEHWLPYPDGRQVYFEIRKVPFYDRMTQQRGLLGFGRDITEHKNSQLALEEANHSKTHFIATISHELRTPLSGIVGLSRLLREEQLDQSLQQRYLKTIYLSALTLNNIFNDIMTLNRFEQRNLKLIAAPLLLRDLIEELEDLGQILVEPKGITFSLQSTEPLPECLLVDGTRLRQILWNLLSNAVKFTLKGGVRLQIYQDSTTTSLFNFEVIDTGIGISDLEQSKIFSMYYRVKGEAELNNPIGAGIGLALSQQIAGVMGGTITVRSQLGQGSCFTLSIPLESVGKPVVPTLPCLSRSLHLLLVEDMDLNIKISKNIIEKLGHTVEVVMSGVQALAHFSPNQYQFILLDIQLPDMSGFEVVKRLRSTYPNELLPPLVALTANVLSDKNSYLTQGMDAVLNKPLSVEALAELIEHYGYSMLKNAISPVQADIHQEAVMHILDRDSLNEYLELLGPAGLTDNLVLFKQILPTYLNELKQQLTAHHAQGLGWVAHKIQNACSSLGFKRLGELAQKIQQANLPQEWPQVKQWVDELHHNWPQDIQLLNQWLVPMLPDTSLNRTI
jgi:two-component system aerobic respiration control sensor histidine kinase ArcB